MSWNLANLNDHVTYIYPLGDNVAIPSKIVNILRFDFGKLL